MLHTLWGFLRGRWRERLKSAVMRTPFPAGDPTSQPPEHEHSHQNCRPPAEPDLDLRLHGDTFARGARLDFAVNVAPLPQPRGLNEALKAELGRLAEYPAASRVTAVMGRIAKFHGVAPENILLTHGAAEAFERLLAFAPDRARIVTPTFTEPEAILTSSGVAVEKLDTPPSGVLDLAGPLRPVDLTVLGTPNNPTGVLPDDAAVAELAAASRVICFDEAFMDIAGEGHSRARLAAATPGMIVVRSLTKTFGLAGLRLGYAIAHPDTLAVLGRGRNHWPLGSLQLAAMEWLFSPVDAAHADPEHDLCPGDIPAARIACDYAEFIRTAREEQIRQLATVGLVPVSDSVAPYILVAHVSRHSLTPLADYLAERSIAVRRCTTFAGLGENYLRLAVRPENQVNQLVTAIAEYQAITSDGTH